MIDYTKFSLPSESAQEGEWREGGRDTGGWGVGVGGHLQQSRGERHDEEGGGGGGGREVERET